MNDQVQQVPLIAPGKIRPRVRSGPASRAVDSSIGQQRHRPAILVATPGAVRDASDSPASPWQAIKVGRHHLPSGPPRALYRRRHGDAGAGLDQGAGGTLTRLLTHEDPGLPFQTRVRSKPAEEEAGGTGDVRTVTALVQADGASGPPSWSARSHRTAATATIDRYPRAARLVGYQLELVGYKIAARPAVAMPCDRRPGSDSLWPGQRNCAVRALAFWRRLSSIPMHSG